MEKKIIVGLISLALFPLVADAQLYQDADNSTAIIVRDPARQASTEIDAVIYNPAGTAFLKDGLSLSLNLNAALQNVDDQYSTNTAWGKNKARSLFPSLQVAYKTGKWAVSGSFAQESGYGLWKNKDGVQFIQNQLNSTGQDVFKGINEQLSTTMLFQELISALSPEFDSFGKTEDLLSIKTSNQKSSTRNYAIRLGGAYQISESLSAYLGLRVNYFTHKIRMDFSTSIYRPSTGENWTPTDYFNKNAETCTAAALQNEGELKSNYESLSAQYGNLAQYFSNMNVKDLNMRRMNGVGVVPIIGLDFNYKFINLAAKYEFMTHVYTTDGYNSFNIPSMLSLGADIQVAKNLKCAVGSNIYFKTDGMYGINSTVDTKDVQVKLENDIPSKTAFDLSGSISYTSFNKLTCSIGGAYQKKGTALCGGFIDNATSNLDCVTLSFGAGYDITDKLQVNAGCSFDFMRKPQIIYQSPDEVSQRYKIGNRTRIAIGVNYNL